MLIQKHDPLASRRFVVLDEWPETEGGEDSCLFRDVVDEVVHGHGILDMELRSRSHYVGYQ